MLIASPRHSAADLRHFREQESLDRMMFRSGALRRLEQEAIDVIGSFINTGPAYVSVSWGKDSVVVAHLLWRALAEYDLQSPLVVWCPAGAIENPDCALVRDEFLARFPLRYEEHPAELTSDDWDRSVGHDGAQAEFERVTRSLGRRHISGVRAEESGIRKLTMLRNGTASENTCRPIGWWRTEHVYAYLAGHDLPVHPAYACSHDGNQPRRLIRVGTIGGSRGRGYRGVWGRAEWERRYYGVGR